MQRLIQTILKQRTVHIGVFILVIFSTLAGIMVVLPHQQAKAATDTSEDLLLVHGYNNSGVAPCNVFGTAKQLFPGLGWTGNIKRLNYYTPTDGNCDTPMDFGDTRCDNYHTLNYENPIIIFQEGETSETIQHIGCRFAWYVWDNYTSQNKNVRVIAHSMGGVVVRWAMYATEIGDKNTLGQNAFPSSLKISRIVTVDSPHNGAGPGLLAGLIDEQATELAPGSDFLNILNSPTGVGLYPQISPTPTYWTTIGSIGDNNVGADTSIYMESNAKIVYRQAPFNDPNMGPQNLDHGSILSDGLLYDASSHAYMDTRPIAPVNYCDANCGVGTPSSMNQIFYYRSVYAIYLHITDSLVPPTPTPVPPTATPKPPTATPTPGTCTKTLLRSNSQFVETVGSPSIGLRVDVYLYASTICGRYEASMRACAVGVALTPGPRLSQVYLQDINHNNIRSNTYTFSGLGEGQCDPILNTAIDGTASEVRAVGITSDFPQVNTTYYP